MTAKKNIEYYNNIAKEKGGRCLSTEYKNCMTKLLWECKEGHQWWTKPNSIKTGNWCSECSGKKKLTIEKVRKICKSSQITLLSEHYTNNNTKLQFLCNICQYKWKGLYNTIQQGGKCPKCANNIRFTYDFVKNFCLKQNIKLLSKKYKNCDTKMKFLCLECNNKWQSTFYSIRIGHGCHLCWRVKTSQSQNTSYKIKHWKNNKILVCIGSWEKQTVEWLNFYKINYIWQPRVFETPLLTEKGNSTTYRPDLYLPDIDLWVEIKGWWRRKISKQKWSWFHKKHPNSELWDKKKLKEMGIL